MRAFALAAAVAFVAGCGGGPVSADSFEAVLGMTVDQAIERLGPPDDKSPGNAGWKDKVRGRDGKVRKWAAVHFTIETMRIYDTSLSPD